MPQHSALRCRHDVDDRPVTALSPASAAAAERLAAAGVASPRHDAEELAAHVLGVRRGALLGLSTRSTRRPISTLVVRRAHREPLQHLTGVAAIPLPRAPVGPGALIPRPETELVAGEAVALARAVEADGRIPVVVDLGTGTGSASRSRSPHEVPGSVVHAVERAGGAGLGRAQHRGDRARR